MTTTTKLTVALIGALNQKVQKELIPQIVKLVKFGDLLPESVIDRVSREPRYACGFTGFKPNHAWITREKLRGETEDDAIVQESGLVGQWLIAVAPTKNEALAAGKRSDGWRYYYASVPDGGSGQYQPGDTLVVAGADHAAVHRVIDMNDAELLEILQDGILRVCSAVSEGEKDRI